MRCFNRGGTLYQQIRSLILLSFILWITACSTPKSGPQTISLPMGYVANVQFSPFYVAKERGYFQDAGFEVNFDYRWETDGIQLVAAGELPFTIASGDQVIQARSQGLPVVAVAAWYQTFPVGIIALEEIPLDQPQDLAGLTIGIPEIFGASYIGLRALLEAGDLTEADITLNPIGYTQLAALTNGTVDAVVVYANNEPIVLAQQGVAFNAIYASEYTNLVSAVVVSSDRVIDENPDMVERFVGAFLQGLEDTISEPEVAFEISKSYIEGLSDNEAVQWPVLQASITLWEAPELGRFTPAAWAAAQSVMQDAGLIDQTVPAERLYTNSFIP